MASLDSAFLNGMRETQTTVAVFIVTFVAAKLISSLAKKRYNLPPGPRNLPIVGYLPFLGKAPAVTFCSLRRIYGNVFSINMGSFTTVVVHGEKAIKEALMTMGDDFSGRPAFTTARLFNEGRNFAFGTFGPTWKAHRKIVSHMLYAFSNARNNPIEDIVVSEAVTVADEFVARGGRPFDPRASTTMAGASMMYQLCYGRHRNIREDPDFDDFTNNSRGIAMFASPGNPVDVMPWLRHVMPWRVTQLLEFLRKTAWRRANKVEEHEKTFDEEHLRDIADGLISAANHLSDEDKAAGMDKRRVLESLEVIFGAGSNTVASVLNWGILLMAAYPEAQKKVFQEIEDVVGLSRYPSLADRSSLPMVEATIYEVLRFASPVPLALPHASVCDTTLQGYDIPKGTVVLFNLHSVLHDEETWGDPENFRPERFLLDNGQLDKAKAELVIVFSLGRRRCVGEFLARMEVFLAFTTLIQRCRFYRPTGVAEYTLGRLYELGCLPQTYEVCAAARD